MYIKVQTFGVGMIDKMYFMFTKHLFDKNTV